MATYLTQLKKRGAVSFSELTQWLATLPHESPKYYQGNIYCNKCGRFWLDDLLDMDWQEQETFLKGQGCPCCKESIK